MSSRATPNHPDPAHPLNFPVWKKLLLLLALSLAAWLANYSAAAHLTALPEVAKDLDATIAAAANSIGLSILGLGTGPLIWNPIAASLGRRPAMLLSFFLFIPCSIWSAFATSYSSFAAARFFSGFTGGSSQTIPATIISETFTPERRGTAISVWALLLILGPVTSPIVGAAFLTTTTWRWIYRLIIIFAGLVWLLLLVGLPETLYIPPQGSALAVAESRVDVEADQHDEKQTGSSDGHGPDGLSKHVASPNLQCISLPAETADALGSQPADGHTGAAWYPWREPLRFGQELIAPLLMARYLVIVIPSITYAVVFMWSVGLNVVTPQALERPPWSFSSIAVGGAILGGAVGSVFGKFAGGYFADFTVSFLQRRGQTRSSLSSTLEGGESTASAPLRKPEYRIWASLPHWPLLLLGLLLYGEGLHHQYDWPMPVIGGLGVYFLSNSALSSIVQTYLVETHIPHSVHAIALFNLIKCCLAFAAPFFIPDWAIGNFQNAYLVQAIVVLVLGLATAAFLIVFGEGLRRWQKMPSAVVV